MSAGSSIADERAKKRAGSTASRGVISYERSSVWNARSACAAVPCASTARRLRATSVIEKPCSVR